MSDLYEYDGYLTFSSLNDKQSEQAHAILRNSGLKVQLTSNSLELQYQGRDTGRWLLQLLAELAPLIHTASGEITCLPNIEGADPVYEFYEIREGKLYLQEGRIVRGPKRVIVPPGDARAIGEDV
ncbi:MAG: hypothetical protein K2R98_15390 [Gemmataceae bacterium]|nr:hypothetical protein [Gemmataceae bacterium]